MENLYIFFILLALYFFIVKKHKIKKERRWSKIEPKIISFMGLKQNKQDKI